MYPLRIGRAEGDLLFDEQGRRYTDLFTAHGTAWLGHGCPEVVAAVREQLGRVWCTGALETAPRAEAQALIEAILPPSLGLAALYSTGMEAAEFALRLARAATGRPGVVGFRQMMHGKSLATAALGWPNPAGVDVPAVERLPFVAEEAEAAILERLAAVLRPGRQAAVFLEPLQGCGGGHMASPDFYRAAAGLCREAGTLLVFDEILTGLYRTGPPFFFCDLGVTPDVVLLGKALGNGFPVAAVAARRDLAVTPAMLPGSTYAGNPLAAAAVVGVLRQLARMDMPPLVTRIADIIRAELAGVGVPLRGRGAFWVLELAGPGPAEAVVVRVYQRGVAVGWAGPFVRLLPPAVIDPRRLTEACRVVAEEVARAR